MIKILSELKKSDKKLYFQVENELERFGGYSSKGYFNRLKFDDYLDLISFADTYTFQPSEYDTVLGVLSDLNPTENTMMQAVKSCTAENTLELMKQIRLQNNRTRQRVLKIVKSLTAEKPSFLKSIQAVFS